MVNVRKRGNVYEYNFDVAKIEGKRKRITKSGFKTKAEAQEAGTVIYEEYIRTGVIVKECQMSYHDYLDFWYENYCKINLKYTIQEAYKNIIDKYLKPSLGLYRLSAITSVILHSFLTELCSKYSFSRSYFKNILKVMKGTFREATDVLGHKNIETTENYYISSTDETRKNVTDSYESTINLDVIDEIIEYKISI